MRRRRGSFATSPVIVGATTVLIALVAVFLAYNANNSLPFVPTYRVYAEMPDANTLVRGNEVRIGGVRVGRVASVEPTTDEDGNPVAVAALDLNQQVQPLPTDTEVMVRPRSTVALKYLELRPGDSDDGFEQGATIPAENSLETVELDQVINTFDPETQENIRRNLTGFGNALAGRGVAINELFGTLRPLVEVAEPVARNLAAPSTGFARFWRSLEAISATVAPVAETQGELFANANTTFAAFAEVARPYIQETISKSPPALDEANRALPVMRPFFRHSAEFFTELRPGVKALADASPVLASAFEVGIPVLRKTPPLNAQLEPTAQALYDFQESPGVKDGVALLTDANEELKPALAFLTPAQATCNYLSLLFRNAASIGKVGSPTTQHGGHTRFAVLGPEIVPNNEGMPSSETANGPRVGRARLSFLHYNPYPYTASPGQPERCSAGNEVYEMQKRVIGNPKRVATTETDDQDVRIGLDGKTK